MTTETSTFPTDIQWPLLDASAYQYPHPTPIPLVHDRGVVFGAYIVPGAGGRLYRVQGGYNWWLDNNCCGSMGFSALQLSYYTLGRGWNEVGRNIMSTSNEHGLRDKDDSGYMVASFERMSVPETSCVLHVREFNPDFPNLSIANITRWFSGVLIASIMGKADYLGRGLIHAVDMVGGSMSNILKNTHACRSSRGVSPWTLVPEQYETYMMDRRPFVRTSEAVCQQYSCERQPPLNNLYIHTGPAVFNTNSGNMIREISLSRKINNVKEVKNGVPQIRTEFPAVAAPNNRLATINEAIRSRPWVTYMARLSPWMYA